MTVVDLTASALVDCGDEVKETQYCSQVYYKEAVAAMIVFDCTRQSTFDAILTWKNDLDSKVLLPNGEPVPCLLLSNKVGISLPTAQ